jgi:L-cystine uptake protein TcyP (sodium:dicarboxylate symporter family)
MVMAATAPVQTMRLPLKPLLLAIAPVPELARNYINVAGHMVSSKAQDSGLVC